VNGIEIGYFADGPWAHQALDLLLADPSIRIAFICARADNPDAVLKRRAGTMGIDFLTHPNINCDEFIQSISKFSCDLFVSMSFNQVFRKRLIDLPGMGTINCHAGKLPFYRGRNILNWVLINDETEFGITVHFVDQGIDTGDLILQRTYPISDSDNYGTLLDRAYTGCAELLFEAIKQLQAGGVRRVPQREIHPIGFYCSTRQSGDELLNWCQSSREVFNFVRAISRPGPEARTFLERNEIRINRVELIADAPVFKGIPGAVVGMESGMFLVKTADSFVRVAEWSGASKIRVGSRLK
jgi:methionyl-tRNA formyltransferase